MKYKSVDELEQFQFHDAEIIGVKSLDEKIEFTLEAVIIKGGNSNNLNYTEQYADTLSMRLSQAELLSAFREGSRYYDANDVLMEQTPDVTIPQEDWAGLLQKLEGGHIFVFEEPDKLKEKLMDQFPEQFEAAKPTQKYGRILAVDVMEHESIVETTYWLFIQFEKSVLAWNRFMNKPEGV